MGYILTVYSQSAYKEYLLPAVRDADHELVLNRELFQFQRNARLRLENRRGIWYFNEEQDPECGLVYTGSRKPAVGRSLGNGDICSLTLPGGDQAAIIVGVTDRFFRTYNKYSLDGVEQISIGKGADNVIQYSYRNVVGSLHATLRRRADHWQIEDHSRNGLFVNSRRVNGSQALNYGDLINIFGLSLVYLDDTLAVDSAAEDLRVSNELRLAPLIAPEPPARPEEGVHLFHSAPRYLPKLSNDTVKIEAPPAPKEENRQPLAMTIGPSMTMAIPMLLGSGMAIISSRASGGASSAFMYTGLITAVSSAVIGTIWALLNLRQAKKKLREDELKRFEVYGEYLISCANKVQDKYRHNTELMRQMYPEAAVCCQYDHTTSQLWNRNTAHEDFLQHRLGLGEAPFQVKVDVPQERFSMLNDSLAEKSRMIQENYAMLQDVPVCVDLDKKVVGVIGGEGRRGCYPIVRALAAQLAACNCYTNVKMAFIYDGQRGDAQQNWSFARWLPHVWSTDKRTRYIAGNQGDASDVFYEIAKVLRMRAEDDQQQRRNSFFKPHYVLFIEDMAFLEGELIASFLLDARKLGVSVILLAERYEDLPNTCEYIVENTSEFQGIYNVTDPIEERRRVRFDQVNPEALNAFARRLGCIQVKEIETGGEIPQSLTFFEMYHVRKLEELNVLERWQKNRTYENIRGLLGQKAGGADCCLDVHEKYHGPHGLVAGTTGSGKSETLQTYMLSLAVNYSPDDVGFFVIDYKGGGMANLFSGLPHMIGQISNLSGNQVHRAMVSIKSENNRRMRVFNENGVNNINSYTRLYKNGEAALPVPHMFIVIDEFAELKREEPEFMKELISVAQVGRSLGVHLILATQKPSGTVDDNIWSNSKFRLCLRVQDRQDSKDMLHRPDAAYITQAGRCYLQVGNDELFELFQSGWSGAEYNEKEDEDSAGGDIALILSDTGKAALVGSYQKQQRRSQEKLTWVASLLEVLRRAGATPALLTACAGDSRRMDDLLDRFFQCAEEAKLEYPRTDYNVQRVRDLVAVCADVGSVEAGSAGAVVKRAGRSGRKLPEPKKRTQLEAVVEYLARTARENGYVHNLALWLPVLPAELYLHQLPGYLQNSFDGKGWPKTGKQWELEAFVGLCDDPVNQAQMPLSVDFANNGNHAILGTVVSGKSTFLLTLLYSLVTRYSPQALNIYALDFSSKMLSAFEGLAHVGGVLYENDGEKIGQLFHMLSAALEDRKTLLRGSNYRQYVQNEAGASGTLDKVSLPAIVVAIDNYSAFRSKTNNLYDDFVLKLSKEGVSCGIFLVIAAMGVSATEIPGRLGENLRTVICLEMNDKYAYAEALRTIRVDVLPEENVKGRGLTKVGDSFLEFQTALPLKVGEGGNYTDAIKEVCKVLNATWTGKRARRIPEIPAKPTWKEFAQLEDVQAMQQKGDRIPVGYDQSNAAIYGVDLRRTYCYLISGKARTGKTNLLKTALASVLGMKGDVVVVDFAHEFDAMVKDTPVRHLTTDKELYDYLVELQPEFIKRNKFKNSCVESGSTDDELYDRMAKFGKIFILIGSLVEFVNRTASPEKGVPNMSGFLGNLLDKGAHHNVFWLACFDQDDSGKLAGKRVYELFVRDRAGVHFGGNVAAQRILDFEYLKFNERTRTLKPGIGMLPVDEENTTERVVVPLYRR